MSLENRLTSYVFCYKSDDLGLSEEESIKVIMMYIGWFVPLLTTDDDNTSHHASVNREEN